MKKLVSLLLVVVIFLSLGTVTAFAEVPPYLKGFDTTEDMILAMEKYAQQFPNPDYSDSEVVAPSDDYQLKNKKIVLPVLPEDYATLESCAILANGFGGGIDKINCTYIVNETGEKYILRGIYSYTDDYVDDQLLGFGDLVRDPSIHTGFVDGYQYSVDETVYHSTAGRCDYFIAVDDVLFVYHTLKLFNTDLLSQLSFVTLDTEFPVYVNGEENLYEDRFLEIYEDEYVPFGSSHYYEELYYHYDSNNEIDWALIEQCSYNSPPWNYHTIYKDRILMYGDYHPFKFRYGVYDVKKDMFVDIFGSDFDFSEYEGLEKVFDSLEVGFPIGDADHDTELTVFDATLIQRALAGLCDFHAEDEINASAWLVGSLDYMSDFNRDGERSILDATAIQMKLARIDNETETNEDMVIYACSDYDEYRNLSSMPIDADLLSFEMEFDKQQFSNVVYNFDASGECYTAAIIKSNEQYNTFFNESAPQFDDEFFEDKWLVVALTSCGCHESMAPITDIGIVGDMMFVRANEYVPDGPTSPTTPMWLSMVSVDKELLAYVDKIIKVD